MKMKGRIEGVGGGMMIIAVFVGGGVKRFGAGRGELFGGFRGGLIRGRVRIVGVFMFCVGGRIDFGC